MTTKVPEDLLQKLRTGHRFLVTSHINPDGDAIGSELGLARTLRTLGKAAVVWNRDETPSLYAPLVENQRIHTGDGAPAGFPETFDGAVVLECPSLDRTGIAGELGDLEVLNIDHHLGNQHYGTVNWVDTASPAVGEMIYRLAKGLMARLDEQTATALFLTLVTDTGCFRFANATATAFEAAADLVREGARPDLVSQWLYESQPASAMRLLGEMLRALELHDEGRVATVALTSEMYERAGASPGDAEGLIDYPRSISGVQAVALIRELGEDRFKVSLRSRGEVDVEKLAKKRGGGGHRNAAGFTTEGAGRSVLEEVVGELTQAIGSS